MVEAALTAGKRELLKFYVSVTAGREEKTKERDARLIGLAKKAGVQVVPVKDTAELDAMAQSRPHKWVTHHLHINLKLTFVVVDMCSSVCH